MQKMHLSMNAAFGFRVPVAIKCAASATSVSVYNNLLRDPYKICGGFFIDGIQGGTGAANEVSLDHTGHPVVSKIRDCYLAAVKQGLQGQIPLYGGGGIGMTGNAAADAFKMMCLGANGVFVGKVLIQLLGCIGNEQGRCNSCNTGKCRWVSARRIRALSSASISTVAHRKSSITCWLLTPNSRSSWRQSATARCQSAAAMRSFPRTKPWQTSLVSSTFADSRRRA